MNPPLQKFSDAVTKELKKSEFEIEGPFGFRLWAKVEPGPKIPIHHYSEKKMETEVVCSNCTLPYCVFGVFAFCPDCGQHNSLQTLELNFEITAKFLEMAAVADQHIAEKLIENAMEDCISAFDGFCRELCRLHASKATDATRAGKISFQNLERAKESVLREFGHDISIHLTTDEWEVLRRNFQKRHLLAHKMGVIDDAYVEKANDPLAIVGRKIHISAEDVRNTLQAERKIARGFSKHLEFG